MKIFYFTATGNCLWVAKEIGGELLSIPQEINKNIECYEDDVIGIVFPTYGCSIPKIIRRFINKTKFKAEYTFAIGTYGNIGAKVMEDMQILANNNGFQFDYVDKILMVDNYLPFFDIDKQIANIPNKKIDENIKRIKENIKNKIKQPKLSYKFSEHLIQPLMKSISKFVEPDDFGKNYIVNNNCAKCGICAKVCPVNNIHIDEKVNFKNYCEVCMACIHSCPKNAIHLKTEKSNTRWINENIKITEIINSNSQIK